jgi:PleD family two-component response regulator
MSDQSGRIVPQPFSEETPSSRRSEAVDRGIGLSDNQAARAPAARILVVDDEVALAELLGEMLSMLGYSPTSANKRQPGFELLGK